MKPPRVLRENANFRRFFLGQSISRHRDDRLHESHLFERRGGAWACVMLQP